MSVQASWYGGRVAAAVSAAKVRGLTLAAAALKDASNQVAPIEEGTMIGSSGTSVTTEAASVFYDTPYAARQHEELTWRHDPGRQAKYLEGPLHDKKGELQKIIANTIEGALGGAS